jgi:hypothetical protein
VGADEIGVRSDVRGTSPRKPREATIRIGRRSDAAVAVYDSLRAQIAPQLGQKVFTSDFLQDEDVGIEARDDGPQSRLLDLGLGISATKDTVHPAIRQGVVSDVVGRDDPRRPRRWFGGCNARWGEEPETSERDHARPEPMTCRH